MKLTKFIKESKKKSAIAVLRKIKRKLLTKQQKYHIDSRLQNNY